MIDIFSNADGNVNRLCASFLYKETEQKTKVVFLKQLLV